jgi:putative spermidine/putrescine transport system ATP-binding protein
MDAIAGQMAPVGTSGPLVRFDRVQKSYDGTSLVVRDLNLDVHRGEFLTLLGPSGSGKTTTLMMLAGFERPTTGHIMLEGRPIDSLPPERRGIGVVFQNYALFPHMTVEQNVAFPLRYRKIRGADARIRVERALSMVRLDGFGSRKPTQLSGGQQQRVALARALVFEPKLVLMDEPLGALDKQLRERMQIEIKQLQRELGLTVVFVTHDQSEALTMSDRVAVFGEGVIQQLALPRELYDEPGNAFVAGFVGENNLIPCTAGDAGDAAITADGTRLPCVVAHPLAPGSKALLAIRPERIMLAEPGGDAVACSRVSGKVMDASFGGDHVRIDFVAFGGVPLTVRLPPSAGIPATGEAAVFDFPHAHCRLIAA